MKEYSKVAQALLGSGAHQAILYVSPKRTIKATRRRFKGKFDRRAIELIFTDGPPNYAERKFIKLLKKAGEAFPVKKVQLRIAK
jgi:hypothetical protein